MNTISVLGAHGTGKTTFCSILGKVYKNYKPIIIPDIARSCPYDIGLNSSLKSQEWIMHRQIKIESLFIQNQNIFTIFDNSSIGHLAYYNYFNGNDKEFIKKALELAYNKSLIILLPKNINFLIDDGLRPTDINFQNAIQDSIVSLLENNKISYFILPLNWHTLSDFEIDKIISDKINLIVDRKITKIVSIGIVTNSHNKILTILRSSKNVPDAHLCWDLPGGSVEYGEDPSKTVEREIFEETGYLVNAIKPIGHIQSNIWRTIKNKIIHIIILCYQCKLIEETKFFVRNDPDILNIEWKAIHEFEKLPLIKGIENFLLSYSN